jgi:hypothetical protein
MNSYKQLRMNLKYSYHETFILDSLKSFEESIKRCPKFTHEFFSMIDNDINKRSQNGCNEIRVLSDLLNLPNFLAQKLILYYQNSKKKNRKEEKIIFFLQRFFYPDPKSFIDHTFLFFSNFSGDKIDQEKLHSVLKLFVCSPAYEELILIIKNIFTEKSYLSRREFVLKCHKNSKIFKIFYDIFKETFYHFYNDINCYIFSNLLLKVPESFLVASSIREYQFNNNLENNLKESMNFFLENKNYFHRYLLPTIKQFTLYQVDSSKNLRKVKLTLYNYKRILFLAEENEDNQKINEIIYLRGYFPQMFSPNYPLFNNKLFPVALMTSLNTSMINIDRLFFFSDSESQLEFFNILKIETNHKEFPFDIEQYVSKGQFGKLYMCEHQLKKSQEIIEIVEKSSQTKNMEFLIYLDFIHYNIIKESLENDCLKKFAIFQDDVNIYIVSKFNLFSIDNLFGLYHSHFELLEQRLISCNYSENIKIIRFLSNSFPIWENFQVIDKNIKHIIIQKNLRKKNPRKSIIIQNEKMKKIYFNLVSVLSKKIKIRYVQFVHSISGHEINNTEFILG